MLALRVVLTILLTSCVHALYTGEFQSTNWIIDADSNINLDENTMTTVYVALKVRNEEELKQSFQDISNPNSVHYGKYLSMADIQRNYSPTADDIDTVMKYFQTISTGAHAEYRMNQKNDILSIKCKVHELERFFNTKLNWYQHSSSNSNKAHAPFKRSLRALKSLENIPSDIQEKVAFISLNSPINHMKPRSTPNDNNAAERSNSRTNTNADSKLHSFSDAEYGSGITITPGNEEALVNFSPFCGDGSVNSDNPPCSSMSSLDIPQFTVFVTQHANNASNPYQLTPEPLSFELSKPNSVYCVNNITLAPCTGSGQPGKCICTAKIAPLPKYTQLRANLTSTLSSGSVVEVLVSNLFVLTDVATIPFLIDLYNMPSGQLVHNANATQAVAEFYGQYYSNSDLDAFMSLSGKFGANIPDANVRVGVNDPSAPGGEAQLDVEYLMGLAPGASTYFYSIDTLNPYSSENEGFLTWLYAVGNETNPPLVQSLSYGDQEASVFPTDNSAAYDYGMRCEVEFMMLGMRGVSILVSSGDDGIASSSVRDDPAGSCTQAWPEWPASSPYVTTVGATQLTNAYIPICNRAYSSAISSTAPMENNLLFQCSGTGETVCSSSTGGVITSGGGFSNVFDREASVSC